MNYSIDFRYVYSIVPNSPSSLNFRVPAEFEIAIGIGVEIGSGNVSLTPIFDPDFDPDPDFGPQLSCNPKV
jgi:hypothetical protein